MRFDVDDLPSEVTEFLSERHLATLTVVRPDGSPQVTPVGVTWDGDARLARIITWQTSVKAKLIAESPGAPVAVCQVAGARWLTLSGRASVTGEPEPVSEAMNRYAERYRPAKERQDRVVIEIEVDRIIGSAPKPGDRS